MRDDGNRTAATARATATPTRTPGGRRRWADWLAGDPTGSGYPDVLIIGDLNAYRPRGIRRRR
ncbi:MAG: hypothetical protein U5K76_01440 [Woeseiaceae bacterium]|nr:hypothetical protein [Woeseiaceae bacterium]